MDHMIIILLTALIQVESSGNDSAVGDYGNAIGCLQIWPCVIEDVNRFSNSSYELADRLNRAKSIEIATLYLKHWGQRAERRSLTPVTYRDLALIWNMGPRGYRLSKTKAGKAYWYKANRAINEVLAKRK